MAAALGDLIRIIDHQLYLDQELMNVYYYRVTVLTGFTNDGYDDILDWFLTNVVQKIAAIQCNTLAHPVRELQNLSNGADLYFDETAQNGGISATLASSAPSFVSAGFILRRESLVTRNGYKRFAGLAESDLSGNTFVHSPTSDITAIETALASDVVLGAVTMLEPVIVKSPVASPPVGAYLYSSIGSAQFRSIGTQNTRKPDA